MAWVALNCPQCSAPLPRVAIWRTVKCPSCGALITRTESVVTRDTFRQAWLRARQVSGSLDGVQCGGDRYHLMQFLGAGEISQVYVAQRIGMLPFLATLKLSSASAAAGRYAREAQVLRELQALPGDAGAFFSQQLPEVVAVGSADGAHNAQHALVLRHPNGYWGSLAVLTERFAQGLDPRHAVWIWRRILAVLGFIHSQGWSHGDVRPEHALVHPQNHGVRLIGWSSAQSGASAKEIARDLMRSARVVLVLLGGTSAAGAIPSQVPAGLSQLLQRAAQDDEFCRSQGAPGLDSQLRVEANTAFGPPTFVPLTI
jgi:serine/threonine protein kinase